MDRVTPTSGARQTLRQLREFSRISFACVALAGVLMGVFFREVAVQGIVEFGEYNNAILAQTMLNSVRAATLDFLNQNRDVKLGVVKLIKPPPV